MKTFTSIALLLLFVQIAQAQSPASPLEAKQMLAQAQTFFDSSQYLACQTQAESVYRYYQSVGQPLPSDLAAAANLIGQSSFSLKQFEKAVSWFEITIKAWDAQFPEGSLQSAEAWFDLGASLNRAHNQEEALKAFQQNLDLNLRLLPQNHCKLSRTQRLIGNTHMELGHYAIALTHYAQALSISNICAGPESIQTADILSNFGKAYLRNGEFDQALAAQEKALLIRQKKLSPNHVDFSDSYMDIGEIYQKLNQFENALVYYDKALENYRVNADAKEIDIAFVYSEIGQYFTAKKDYEKALEYLDRCNEIMLRKKYDENAAYAFLCANYGSVYLGKKDYPLAIEWFEKMVAIWRKTNTQPNTQLGSMLTHLGRAKLTAEQFEAAKPVFEESKQVYESVLGPAHPLASKADMWLGNTYRKWYLKTGQDSLLSLSREHYKIAVAGTETQMLKEFTQTGQKKALAESMPVLERAISAEALAYKAAQQSPEILKNAWKLSEAAHAYLLLAATQEVNARRFSGIPVEELGRDSALQAAITSLQLERKSLLEDGHDLTDSAVLALNLAIYDKKESAQKLKTYFETKYPDYYRLKYQLHSATLQETQQRLSPQQTLLEYFVGDFEVFILVVQHDSSRMLAIPRDFPIKDWTYALREGISGYFVSDQKSPELYRKTVLQYADAAQKLYDKLIAPVAESLTSELIIIPFEGLAHIPFEALLSAAPKDPGNFGSYPFLLQKHSVQYAHSATMLHQMTDRVHAKKTSGDLLAFAPFFEKDSSALALRVRMEDSLRLGFSALPYSGEEIVRAQKQFGKKADLYFGQNASKKKFLEQAAKYKVLHLATHGKANQTAGEFSYLAFASDRVSGKNELLSVAEMYNLPINADLVILSACETGLGEQQKGEGVISLARAFAYAGAKSIVASLWSVNDQSTMQIMEQFYVELKAGKPKNIALANAKRNYLTQNPGKQAHPFFWAAFIGLGDMTALKN